MTISLVTLREHRYGLGVPAESVNHRVSPENRTHFRVLVRLTPTGRIPAHTASDVGARGCAIARVRQHTERGRGSVSLAGGDVGHSRAENATDDQQCGTVAIRDASPRTDARWDAQRELHGAHSPLRARGFASIRRWALGHGGRRATRLLFRHGTSLSVTGKSGLGARYASSTRCAPTPMAIARADNAPWHRTAHSAIDPTLVGMVDGTVGMCLRPQAWHESAVSP